LVSCGVLPDSATDTENVDIEKGFTVYFIDVGQADAALIVCDGATMLIDGGNAADSSLMYSFLHSHEIAYLDYIIATHAHEDHVGGLSGALNYATVGVALSPVKEYDSRAFNSFVKYLNEQDVPITIPSPGDTFKLGSADVSIIGPVKEYSDINNTSIVLKITYGATSFLFTGDAERTSELDILETGTDLSSMVLKVAHHGSDSSTIYPFLREVMPQYAVISCGQGNSYGHPNEDMLSRLRDADVHLYRTDMQGTITCTSDGESVCFIVERNANIETNPTVKEGGESYYIGNMNTRKFHRPSCSGLPAEQNRVILETYEEAITKGFEPCGICMKS